MQSQPPGQQRKHDFTIKLMMIGDSGVGKTALLVRYADEQWMDSVLPTIGIDFKIKHIERQGRRIRLQIWDTAGQERFRTITQAYYRGAMGILLCYDVSNERTLTNIRNWVRNIEGNAPQTVNKILVGNKCDVAARQVTTAQGEQLAQEFGMKFFETSAFTNSNVSEAFETLATDVVERLLAAQGEQDTSGVTVAPAPDGSSQRSGCC